MRLSTRIAIPVGITVPLLVLAAGWLLVRLVANDLDQQRDERLRARGVAIASIARDYLLATSRDRPAAARLCHEKLLAAAMDVGIRLSSEGGTEVRVGPQPRPKMPYAGIPTTVLSDGQWRVLSFRINGPRPDTRGTLSLFARISDEDATIRSVRHRILWVAILASPLSALLALYSARHATRPLRLLEQQASGLDPQISHTRPQHVPSGISEVDSLASTFQTVLSRFDEQARRTEEALETARSFTSAASHELRTPLMSMRTNLDTLAEYPDLSPQTFSELVEDLRSEHKRLMEMLEMFRALARGDLVEADAFTTIDLVEVLEAAVSSVRRRAPHMILSVKTVPGLQLYGWEPGLRMVLDNLLTNAVIHGCRSGEAPVVDVQLRSETALDGAYVVLTVDDRGPGIAPKDHEGIFQRYKRRPDSPGSGLGLTLVAQQVALHRGSVWASTPSSGIGTRFVVRLPINTQGTAPTTPHAHRDWLTGTLKSQ
ncbi:sensor histidine kinase [Streptomyces sp. NPDC085932]|uniref:sensor histidine kinase n=1 Tax=Streptomyces sp. NPDC085932 TaxID=3365741 RepID=UPI0037CDBB67